MNARYFPLMVGVLLAVFGLGLVTPPKAQANDLGKVLLGVAAGALLYGLISDNDRDNDHYRNCERYWDRDHSRYMWREKYWDQGHNRYAWRARPDLDARDRDRYSAPKPQPQPQFNQGGRYDDRQGNAGWPGLNQGGRADDRQGSAGRPQFQGMGNDRR